MRSWLAMRLSCLHSGLATVHTVCARAWLERAKLWRR